MDLISISIISIRHGLLSLTLACTADSAIVVAWVTVWGGAIKLGARSF